MGLAFARPTLAGSGAGPSKPYRDRAGDRAAAVSPVSLKLAVTNCSPNPAAFQAGGLDATGFELVA